MANGNIITKNYNWKEINDKTLKWIQTNDGKYKYLLSDVVDRTYPALKTSDKNILLEGLVIIVNYLHNKFARNNSEEFWKQLTQNNNIDLRAILNMLLPFINDNEADDNKKRLKSLRDLYLEQNSDGKYVYTNSQYNRCVRELRGDDIVVYKRPFSIEYFDHHLNLLLMSIEMCANKLYVNWVDVLPATMNNYKDSVLYKDTQQKIIGDNERKIEFVALINNYIDPLPGLSYQDVYNVMANHLYYQIRNYRWLIYDINVDNQPTTYLNYLENIITMTPLWDKKLWAQLSKGEQSIFSIQWEKFFNSTNSIDNTILHHFYFYFTKYHRNSNVLLREGKLQLTMDIGDEMEENEDDVQITPETTRNAKLGLANTPDEEIYSFIYDQLNAFRKSWFYYFLKIKNGKYIDQNDDDVKIYITPKNIYNYSKSFIHDVNSANKFVPYPKYWASLNPSQINKIMYRMLDIRNDAYDNWFNINNYFRRLYSQIPENQLAKANYNMHVLIRRNLVDIIFESLIYHGILSLFVPTPAITDKFMVDSKVGSDNNKIAAYRRSQMKKLYFTGETGENYKNNAYYYLTNESYGKLPKVTDLEYFDFLSTSQIWTFTYAMNWVSQINFYHHYSNNRVIYITGATGVGKSTQVPKLILYAQKMLDYNNNGKIICTQPRVEPTVENAETISRELGVSIVRQDSAYELKVPTNMYYVQYQYQKGQHVNPLENSFLRIVTDGTLLKQIINSPFLTRANPDPNAFNFEDENPEWVRTYSSNNRYDTVIVDEAHEHGINMDIILTLARDSVYVNNSLKLVIVSATMDDDEPIYRRYYRNINDNRAYPLSAYIENNILDRANMDRRVHISPPGGTTQYVIKDHFLTKAESDLINSKNFVQYGINKTLEVISKTTSGDLLVFLSGQSDITKAVKEINEKTPANIISFGYYSELTDLQKDFIRKIHINLPKYTRFKEDTNLEENEITRRVPAGTYTRAVIIATNVAEASITLTNLRYVIDTGYAKVNVYDPITGQDKLVTTPISWSSSQQRRGRVGRLAAGEVYYLYDREKIINNKTAYNITNVNITNTIVDLIKKDPNDSNIITEDNDINNIRNIMKFISLSKQPSFNDILVYQLLKNPHPYLDIIAKQYLYQPDLKDISQYYKYIGKTSLPVQDEFLLRVNREEYMLRNHDDYHFQMNLKNDFVSKNYTGYDWYELEDKNLSFYLIHPDENIIERNPYTGVLVGFKKSDTVSRKYIDYLVTVNEPIDIKHFRFMKTIIAIQNAETKLLITDVPSSDTNVYLNYTDVSPNAKPYIQDFFYSISMNNDKLGTIWVRTDFLANLQEISNMATNLDIFRKPTNLLWYAYSIPFNLEKDVLALLVLLAEISDISQLMDSISSKNYIQNFFAKQKARIEKFKSKHLTTQGDIYVLWNLWTEIKSVLLKNNIYRTTEISATTKNNFEQLKNKYMLKQFIPYSDYVVIDKMNQMGQLNTDHEFYYYVTKMEINFDNAIKSGNPTLNIQIVNIAKIHSIDEKIIISFIEKYLSALAEMERGNWLHTYKIENGLAEEDEKITDIMDWAKNKLALPSVFVSNGLELEWDHILESYLRAFSSNVVETQYPEYIDITTGGVFEPENWMDTILIEKTFLKGKNKYLVYHNEQFSGNYIAYLTPVQLEWMLNLNPIYYYYLLFNKNNVIHQMAKYPENSHIIKILDEYKSKFDFGRLFQYLDLIGEQNIARRIRNRTNLSYQVNGKIG